MPGLRKVLNRVRYELRLQTDAALVKIWHMGGQCEPKTYSISTGSTQ